MLCTKAKVTAKVNRQAKESFDQSCRKLCRRRAKLVRMSFLTTWYLLPKRNGNCQCKKYQPMVPTKVDSELDRSQT